MHGTVGRQLFQADFLFVTSESGCFSLPMFVVGLVLQGCFGLFSIAADVSSKDLCLRVGIGRLLWNCMLPVDFVFVIIRMQCV